jgi:uncharacterized membrane protein YqjE
MWPRWIDLVLSLDTRLRERKIGFLDIWQRPKNVLLDHGHDVVEVRYDETDNVLLILQVLLNLIDCIKPLSFAFYILRLILVVIVLLADEQFFLETFLTMFLLCHSSVLNLIASTWRLALTLTSCALRFTGIFLVLFR